MAEVISNSTGNRAGSTRTCRSIWPAVPEIPSMAGPAISTKRPVSSNTTRTVTSTITSTTKAAPAGSVSIRRRRLRSRRFALPSTTTSSSTTTRRITTAATAWTLLPADTTSPCWCRPLRHLILRLRRPSALPWRRRLRLFRTCSASSRNKTLWDSIPLPVSRPTIRAAISWSTAPTASCTTWNRAAAEEAADGTTRPIWRPSPRKLFRSWWNKNSRPSPF